MTLDQTATRALEHCMGRYGAMLQLVEALVATPSHSDDLAGVALCYDVHTSVAYLLDTGSFSVYAGVDPLRTAEALGEVARELRRIREPVDADELERAQALARSRVQLRMEDTRAVSALYGALTALELPLVSPEQTIERYDAVTIEDVQRVAERVVSDSALRLSVVGPFEDAEPLEAALRPAE